MGKEEKKEKDKWDKVDIILKPVGGLLTAIAVSSLGLLGSDYLKKKEKSDMISRERMQTMESNVRLYSELMSKREEAESALRKDMFNSIIGSFLKPESALFEEKVLNLELLAYNFHESLNLKPLFGYLKKKLTVYKGKDKDEYALRLNKVAREIAKKQMLSLENAGDEFSRTVVFDRFHQNPEGFPLPDGTITIEGIERDFRIVVLKVDAGAKEIKVRLEVRTPKGSSGEMEVNVTEFWIGYFDFPMIDNIHLSHDQRCALVLTNFEESSANVAVVGFPGSYASLKGKPHYQEIIQNLLKIENIFREDKTK